MGLVIPPLKNRSITWFIAGDIRNGHVVNDPDPTLVIFIFIKHSKSSLTGPRMFSKNFLIGGNAFGTADSWVQYPRGCWTSTCCSNDECNETPFRYWKCIWRLRKRKYFRNPIDDDVTEYYWLYRTVNLSGKSAGKFMRWNSIYIYDGLRSSWLPQPAANRNKQQALYNREDRYSSTRNATLTNHGNNSHPSIESTVR